MDFLVFVKKTQNDLKHLEVYIEELKKNMTIKQTSIQTKESEENLDLRIDSCITTFSHTSKEIKSEIDKAASKTRELKNTGTTNTYLINMRESHILALSKKLSSLLKLFQDVQHNYKQKEKERLREVYKIACPQATAEEIEELEDPDKAEKMIEAALTLSSTSSKNVLAEAKNRKDRIEKIVEKINELVNLIAEIDKIVSSNSAETDRIVLNMEDAARNASQARQELVTARSYQNRRNWYIRLFGGTFIIIIAILIIFVIRLLFP